MTRHALTPEIEAAVNDPAYNREHAEDVTRALEQLGCTPSDAFKSFYAAKMGPFSSDHTGFSLLDIVQGRESIVTQTEACREEHGFPDRYLAISDLLGNAVLVYDCTSDAVFNVDFEGGHEELVAGSLAPRWPSFDAFLNHYFLGR